MFVEGFIEEIVGFYLDFGKWVGCGSEVNFSKGRELWNCIDFLISWDG